MSPRMTLAWCFCTVERVTSVPEGFPIVSPLSDLTWGSSLLGLLLGHILSLVIKGFSHDLTFISLCPWLAKQKTSVLLPCLSTLGPMEPKH